MESPWNRGMTSGASESSAAFLGGCQVEARLMPKWGMVVVHGPGPLLRHGGPCFGGMICAYKGFT